LIPAIHGGILFEYGHRVIAGTVALLTWVMTFLIFRSCKSGSMKCKAARFFSLAASIGIFCQAVLGGITVLLRLPPAISIAHACLGQIVFCLLLGTASKLSPAFEAVPSFPEFRHLWKWGAIAAAALFAQLIFGAIYRHTGERFAWHVIGAVLATFAVTALIVISFIKARPWMTAWTILLAALLPSQLLLGILSWRLRLSPDFMRAISLAAALPTAHVVTGALLLGTTFLWTLKAYELK